MFSAIADSERNQPQPPIQPTRKALSSIDDSGRHLNRRVRYSLDIIRQFDILFTWQILCPLKHLFIFICTPKCFYFCSCELKKVKLRSKDKPNKAIAEVVRHGKGGGSKLIISLDAAVLRTGI